MGKPKQQQIEVNFDFFIMQTGFKKKLSI